MKRIAGRGRPECRSRLSSTRPREFVPTLPVSTHCLCAMPTRSGRSYSIEAGSMNHVRESPEEHEIEEGEMERRPTKGFWEVILELLSIIPELVDVLRTRGLTRMQHCCAGSVTCGILVTVVLLYFLMNLQEVETVCLFASHENCQTLAGPSVHLECVHCDCPLGCNSNSSQLEILYKLSG